MCYVRYLFQVQSRILHSMVPKWNANYITDHVQPLPDLYGLSLSSMMEG